jgi:hypothetical protein
MVPAQVAGQWLLEGLPGTQHTARLSLSQRYQRLAGSIEIDGRTAPVFAPSIEGARLEFRFVDSADALKTVRLQVSGNELEGDVAPPHGMLENPPERHIVRGRRPR